MRDICYNKSEIDIIAQKSGVDENLVFRELNGQTCVIENNEMLFFKEDVHRAIISAKMGIRDFLD
jgi:hypothetical protein